MELSINAIITIVIAFMLLGLGLGLIQGILSVGGNSLAQVLEGYVIDIPATSDNRLVIADPLRLDSTKPTIVLTSFYNGGHELCDDNNPDIGAWLHFNCPNQEVLFERLQTVPLNIPPGKAKNVALSVSLASGIPSDTYLCFVEVYCSNIAVTQYDKEEVVYSEPLFVKVSS